MSEKKPRKKYFVNPKKKTIKLSTEKGYFDLSKNLPQNKLKMIHQMFGSKFVKYE